MIRLITIFILFFTNLFPVVLAEEMCNGTRTNDIVCPEFKIDLKNLDPVHDTTVTVPTGVDAVVALLEKIAALLFFVLPLIAGISLVIAGYYYVLSSGDSEKASRAKQIIKWNAIAILIALFSYAIIKSIAFLLEGTP